MAMVPFDAPHALTVVEAAPEAAELSEWDDGNARVQALLEAKLEKDEIAHRDGAGSQKFHYLESWRAIQKV